MSIQYTQRMMDMTVREILTVLFNDTVEGLARFGCGMVGLPYPYEIESSADLPVATLAELSENRESK